MPKKLILFCFIFILPFVINGQVVFKGLVVDSVSNFAIPYSTIYHLESGKGMEVEEDGYFSFTLPEDSIYTFIIRNISYQTDTVFFNSIPPELTVFKLRTKVYDIAEFEKASKVPLYDPWKIVRKAIRLIPENYPEHEYNFTGEYTDYFQHYNSGNIECIQKKNVKITCFKEGVIKDSVQVLSESHKDVFWGKFRYNNQVVLPQYHIPDFGTNHLGFLLNMNPVANSTKKTFDFVQSLNYWFTINHYFKLLGVYEYGNNTFYYIKVYLKGELRHDFLNYSQAPNVLPGKATMYTAYSMGLPSSGIAIGRMLINTEDFGIQYFEYCNGDLNDRYKFCVEYSRKNKLYYPSKLYFGNKFKMAPNPNFSEPGETVSNFYAERGAKWYKNTLKEFESKGENSVIREITTRNTIITPNSSVLEPVVPGERPSFNSTMEVNKIEARLKIAEEVLDSLKYNGYGKYLHHRFLSVNLFSDMNNGCVRVKPDEKSLFDKMFYFIGDKSFTWYLNPVLVRKKSPEQIKADREAYEAKVANKSRKVLRIAQDSTINARKVDTENSSVLPDAGYITKNMFRSLRHRGTKEVIGHYVPFVPMPITSVDEYRYIYRFPINPSFYDKPDLVKGKIFIRTSSATSFDSYWQRQDKNIQKQKPTK